jgi:hypothetical protein
MLLSQAKQMPQTLVNIALAFLIHAFKGYRQVLLTQEEVGVSVVRKEAGNAQSLVGNRGK